MSHDETIHALAFDPAQLEKTYQAALQAGDAAPFRQAITSNYARQPITALAAAAKVRTKTTMLPTLEPCT